jgi:hypothetical protein
VPRSETASAERRSVEVLEIEQPQSDVTARVTTDLYVRTSVPTGCTDENWYAFTLAANIAHRRRGFVRLVQKATRALLSIWPTVLVVATELQRRRTIDGTALRLLVQR